MVARADVHRRPLGRARRLAILAAIVMIVGCLPALPWFTIGGQDLPVRVLTAFGGSGILVFLAALGVIAMVTLPYATDQPVPADRTLVYGLLLALEIVGIAIWPVGLATDYIQGLLPDRAPGLWLAALGIVMLGRAVFEMAGEPPRL